MDNRPSCLHTVIALADAGGVPALVRDAERALAAGSRTIVVDLRAGPRIDTPMLCELAVALRTISRRRATLAVVGADARVAWVLALCTIDDLQCHPTLRGALAEVRDGRGLTAPRRWRALSGRRPDADVRPR